MKAVRFHETGGPEVLVYEEVSDPILKDGEVLIRVEAAGVNFADVMRRRGDNYPMPSPPPFILGSEVAGTIVQVGNGVTSPQVGTSVVVAQDAGGYAEYITAPAQTVIPLPPGIDPVQAAALVVKWPVGSAYSPPVRSTCRRSKRPDRSRGGWCWLLRCPVGKALWCG